MVKIDRQITAENDPKRRSGASLPILVVDDSNVQLRILASLVKRMGHKVVMASSGQEALDAYENGIFSIIISDWMMPDMDGLDLCRAIRKRSPDAYIYFILLTSKGEKDDIAQGLDAGADDFLTKPVNGEELRARMTAGQRIIDVQQELRRTLTKLRELYDAVDRDLIEARKLQHSLIREPLQNHGAATLSLFLQSSGRVGGDLVGTYPIDENKFGAYSIDVSGHGVASALLSARLAGYLSSTSPEQNIALSKVGDRYCPLSPSDVVAMLNDLILNEVETEHYFTIALTHIDASTGAVVMCQAGHPHPALQNIDGSVEFVGNGGMPVGLLPEAKFVDTEFFVRPGSRLLLYSDGVTECENSSGRLLDEEGLERILFRSRDQVGLKFHQTLIQGLSAFCGRDEFDDDVSALLIEI